MSSLRRIAASRANGSKSKGPVTPEGKARSAANAVVTHGLAARAAAAPLSAVIHNEDRQEFLALYEAFTLQFLPANPVETQLVYELATTRWRWNRSLALESSLMDDQMVRMIPEVDEAYELITESNRAAQAFRALIDTSGSLAAVHRYEARLSRQFARCVKLLTVAIRERRAGAHETGEQMILPAEPNPIIEHSRQPAPEALADATNSKLPDEPAASAAHPAQNLGANPGPVATTAASPSPLEPLPGPAPSHPGHSPAGAPPTVP